MTLWEQWIEASAAEAWKMLCEREDEIARLRAELRDIHETWRGVSLRRDPTFESHTSEEAREHNERIR